MSDVKQCRACRRREARGERGAGSLFRAFDRERCARCDPGEVRGRLVGADVVPVIYSQPCARSDAGVPHTAACAPGAFRRPRTCALWPRRSTCAHGARSTLWPDPRAGLPPRGFGGRARLAAIALALASGGMS